MVNILLGIFMLACAYACVVVKTILGLFNFGKLREENIFVYFLKLLL